MLLKEDLIKKAKELNFNDIGFTTIDDFDIQKELLKERHKEYRVIHKKGLNLMEGTEPSNFLPNAKSIIVLIAEYFKKGFPASLIGKFGRCYLDDDRFTKDELYLNIKAFREYLRKYGIESKIPPAIPQRLAAARAGLGTFGKNCLFYSNKLARNSSWVSPIVLIIDHFFEPDEPTTELGCPEWCRNACITACPTGALKGPRKIEPQKCISFLTYYGEGLTPKELREPMGMWVYGCDHCQEVCPRNKPWLTQDLPMNERVVVKEENFQLIKLLHMDDQFFKTKIWPHMFYMPLNEIWRWKMNVARVMGNSLEPQYVPELIKEFSINNDERVRGIIAWALGKIGTIDAKKGLEEFLKDTNGIVKEEILEALKNI